MIGLASNRRVSPDPAGLLRKKMNVLKPTIAFTLALLLLVVCLQGQDAGFRDLLGRAAQPVVTSNISSTAVGGPWSSPSTWIGGIVPAASDDVTIVPGATVIIDIAATANSVTVGGAGSFGRETKFAATEGGAPAVLRFGDTVAFSLTVAHDVTIGPGDTFSTGGGNGNHVLRVGGNLINNGTLDFVTNNNQTGASLVFDGNSSNTFGGTGPVTDILAITIDKGNSSANILELSPSNFTVRGSTTDGPGSNFLSLIHGTFKISGTFSGNHGTFSTPEYTIPVNTGLWLNNPHYTIEAQPGSVALRGTLRLTAGAYNVGAAINDSLIINPDSTIIIEGGTIDTAGRFSVQVRNSRLYYTQTGGTVTTCKVGQTSVSFACFDLGEGIDPMDLPHMRVEMTGGDIVIQNAALAVSGPRDFRNKTPGGIYNITGTGLVIGNDDTSGPGNFSIEGYIPNLLIHTVAGGHSVKMGAPVGQQHVIRDVEIGPGGSLDTGNNWLIIQGNRFVNNGTFKADGPNSTLIWIAIDNNPSYSGTGVVAGIVSYFYVTAPGLILDPASNNIRVRRIDLAGGSVINANKLTIGNNDAITSEIVMGTTVKRDRGSFDTAPVFELGTGGQRLTYLVGDSDEGWTTGVEVNPSRTLVDLAYKNSYETGPLVIDGGDITVTGSLDLYWGEIQTGAHKIIHTGTTDWIEGWVNGTLERPFSAPGTYTYHVGSGGVYSPVTALNVNPSSLSVKAVDSTLPGLSPQVSASRYWSVIETGDLAATLAFTYHNIDVNGDESLYRTWRSNGGPPVYITGSTANPGTNTVTSASGLIELTGDWGLGIAPVSVSGRVLNSGGTPIRNALLILTGGSLTAPRVFQTGNFGTYVFDDLPAGETYTLRIGAKRYRFSQLSWEITPQGNITNLDFVANPQE